MPEEFEEFEEDTPVDGSSEPVVSEGFEDETSSLPADADPLPSDEAAALPVEEEVPPSAEEAPPSVEEEAPPSGEESPPPAEGDDQISSGGGSGGAAVDLDSALGSLTAFLDTRERLSNPELELAGIETFALSPITSSSGLKGVLLEIIGPYDNIVTQYRYQQNTSSNYTYVNEVTPDYPWIASASLFIVLVFSLFSLLKRSFSSWLR